MDHEQLAQGERHTAAVRAPRRRLIKGAALAGPAILTLGTRRAWAVSSCGQVLRSAGGEAGALQNAGHGYNSSLDDNDDGINDSCMTSSGLQN